jgi:hypothetical protein
MRSIFALWLIMPGGFIYATTLIEGAQERSTSFNQKKAWKLAWADEFEGHALDTGKWSYELGQGNWGWGNGEWQTLHQQS